MSNNVADSVEKPGFFSWYRDITRRQWLAFTASFGGWTLDAMDLLLYIYALPSIRDTWDLTDAQAGWLFGITLAASAAGGILFGMVADYFGRVRTMMFSITLFSVFTGLSAFAPDVYTFAVCRIFVGLGMGGEWAAGEILSAETWPRQHRGKVLGMVTSGWSVGYTIAATLAIIILPYGYFNWTFPFFGDIEFESWRLLFVIGILPAFFVFFVRWFVAEPEVWEETSQMRKQQKLDEQESQFTFLQLFHKDIRGYAIKATIFTSFCMVAYWGLNTWIPTYLASPRAEGGAGLGLVRGYSWTIAINVGAFIGCNVFGAISDRWGRRPTFVTFLVGTAVMVPIFGTVNEIADFIPFMGPELLLMFIAPLLGFFGTGFYSGFGAVMSEVFPTRARATAQGFCYNTGRGVAAFSPYIFATVAGITIGEFQLGYGFSLITASVFALAAAATILTFPETKGKQLKVG